MTIKEEEAMKEKEEEKEAEKEEKGKECENPEVHEVKKEKDYE